MSKSIFYNTQFCRPKWRIKVFYISLMNTRNAWRRISSLFMKCVVVVVVMLIYLHIFVGWLVLVYRCCCVQNSPPAFVSWSLGPMHVNKLENFASIRYCMAYYRLGTLDFVEICGILRIEAVVQCTFLFCYHCQWFRGNTVTQKMGPFRTAVISIQYILVFLCRAPLCTLRAIIVKYDKICPNT